MIVAITGTPGTGKTEIAKALAKMLGWKWFSLNELAEKGGLYEGYDRARESKIVDIKRLREEVNTLANEHANLIIESHYAHDMPADVVFVLRTEPSVLRKRMMRKGFRNEKVAENLEAEMMEVIKDEAFEAHKNAFEIDTTRKTADDAAREMEKILKSRPFLEKDLVVPRHMLMDFRRPFGKVYAGAEDDAARKVVAEMRRNKSLVVTVGDSTSYYLIKHGLKPDMIIVDGKEKRRKFTHKIGFRGVEITVKNPAGRITAGLWKAVEDSVKELGRKRVKILVKGEEDLAVLPCAIHLPLGSRIVYGQFDEGLIVVHLDEGKKERAKAILENIMFSQ
jgi:broad-specificity NMP kinase/uncharacterized protein (UPF0218 family)